MKLGTRLLLVWLMLLPATALWSMVARAKGLGGPWLVQLPLALCCVALAMTINSAPPWQSNDRFQALKTLGSALLLTFALYAVLALLAWSFLAH